jgi:serine/threonine protein kinase
VFAYLLTGGHPFEPWNCSSSQVQPMSRDVMNMLGETASAEIEHSPQDGPICQAIVRGTLSLPNLRFGKEDSQGESVSLPTVKHKSRPPQLTHDARLVRELMYRLLAPDPTQRITAAAAVRSAWMSSSEQELLELYRRIVG